jgi:hypothetical protein
VKSFLISLVGGGVGVLMLLGIGGPASLFFFFIVALVSLIALIKKTDYVFLFFSILFFITILLLVVMGHSQLTLIIFSYEIQSYITGITQASGDFFNGNDGSDGFNYRDFIEPAIILMTLASALIFLPILGTRNNYKYIDYVMIFTFGFIFSGLLYLCSISSRLYVLNSRQISLVSAIAFSTLGMGSLTLFIAVNGELNPPVHEIVAFNIISTICACLIVTCFFSIDSDRATDEDPVKLFSYTESTIWGIERGTLIFIMYVGAGMVGIALSQIGVRSVESVLGYPKTALFSLASSFLPSTVEAQVFADAVLNSFIYNDFMAFLMAANSLENQEVSEAGKLAVFVAATNPINITTLLMFLVTIHVAARPESDSSLSGYWTGAFAAYSANFLTLALLI